MRSGSGVSGAGAEGGVAERAAITPRFSDALWEEESIAAGTPRCSSAATWAEADLARSFERAEHKVNCSLFMFREPGSQGEAHLDVVPGLSN